MKRVAEEAGFESPILPVLRSGHRDCAVRALASCGLTSSDAEFRADRAMALAALSVLSKNLFDIVKDMPSR